MINRFSVLILFGLLLSWSYPRLSAASYGGTDTHTHTSTIELKPASLSNSYQTASVCFLGVGDCSAGGFDDMDIDTAQQCLNEGYSKLNCNSVQQIDGLCPYNSAYGKKCVCNSNLITCPTGQTGIGESCGGKYASCGCASDLISCPSNKNGQGTSCGGKYQSCVCKPEYKYTSSNCTSPRSVSGSSCDGKYTSCNCPTGVSAGAYGCKEYYPAPCGSVCKTAKGDNCDSREAVATPYGCMSYFSDCPSKCERAYPDNCRNRTAVTCQFGCTSNFADCSSKCQSCEADNCANRTAVSTPYGCQTYWSDCSSKCQTAYKDNCHNRTAVSTPSNASCSAYYSDCSSKCSAWACNSGYSKSGDGCVASEPKVTIKWTSGTAFKLANVQAQKTGSAYNVSVGNISGTSGTLEYKDISVGDTLTVIQAYGILEGSTTGSDGYNVSGPATVHISESKNYTLNVTFNTNPTPVLVPLAYVEEKYSLSGGRTEWYQEFYNALVKQENTKLYTDYTNPEHFGQTSSGGRSYSLKGYDSSTSLMLYFTPEPSVSVAGSGAGTAYCRISKITKNGSSVSFDYTQYYTQIKRYTGEPEMTVVIEYNCPII